MVYGLGCVFRKSIGLSVRIICNILSGYSPGLQDVWKRYLQKRYSPVPLTLNPSRPKP